MIPPAYRCPLLPNAWVLAAVALLFGLVCALGQDEGRISGDQVTVLLLLLPVLLVGVLLNAGLTIRALLKKPDEPIWVYMLAAGLWFLLFYVLLTVLGALGSKIGG